MTNKTKIALVAAFALSSASAALADDLPYTADKSAYLRNPNAPVPTYNEQVAYQATPRGQAFQLVEGRNVGINVPAAIPSDQKHWYDRNSADFNS